MKRLIMLLVILTALAAQPVLAQDQIRYSSHPDALVVFFNDIAYARDTVTLPGDVAVQIVLPSQVFPDTLILREDGLRVPEYRLTQREGQLVIAWDSTSTNEIREVSVEYLLSGVGWSPKYDMWLGEDEDTTVALDFFAQIRNSALTLDEVDVRLVAGWVDLSQTARPLAEATMNQFLAGYDDATSGSATFTGSATIQHVYDLGQLTAVPGDNIYTRIAGGTLPARRLHLWNAPSDNQVTVIYKVRNVATVPFAEGIVRNYQHGLFVGSDGIEQTPIGSEGSVTVGSLQNVRVNRTVTQRSISGPSDRDDLHEIVLTLENFSDGPVEIEVVDIFPAAALEFEFSQTPQQEGDNVLRWVITIEAGEKFEIRYTFKT